MAIKRKKRRYTWFPGLGQFRAVQGGNQELQNFTTFTLTPIDGPAQAVFPIAADEGEDEDSGEEASSFLNDSLGQDYFIERVVGKFFCHCGVVETPPEGDAIGTMLVTAGIFVGPKAPGAPGQALGASSPDTYSPLLAMNVDQPWMWRNTWLIGNPGKTLTSGLFGGIPVSNVTGHGEAGPHLDIRSVRRVHKNERLFLAVSAEQAYPFESAVNIPTVQISYDLRILGALRRARNESNYRP